MNILSWKIIDSQVCKKDETGMKESSEGIQYDRDRQIISIDDVVAELFIDLCKFLQHDCYYCMIKLNNHFA